jgi:hypothetical protein
MSQTTLALLIALISVSGSFITTIIPWFEWPHSDLRVIYEHGHIDEITLLARNEGRAGGVLRLDGFDLDGYLYPTSSEPYFVEAGKERTMAVKVEFTAQTCGIVHELLQRRGPSKRDFESYAKARESKQCHFQSIETSFNSYFKTHFIPVPCEDVLGIHQCPKRLPPAGALQSPAAP